MIELGPNYHDFDPARYIRNIRVPIFIISGKNDTEVDPSQGEYLYNLANDPKEYWAADTGHDVHLDDPGDFEQRVLSFLANTVGQ